MYMLTLRGEMPVKMPTLLWYRRFGECHFDCFICKAVGQRRLIVYVSEVDNYLNHYDCASILLESPFEPGLLLRLPSRVEDGVYCSFV